MTLPRTAHDLTADTDTGGYGVAPPLRTADLIAAPADWLRRHDPVIQRVTAFVQDRLAGRAGDIAVARGGTALRAEIAAEIDRLARGNLAAEGGPARGSDRDVVLARVRDEVLGLGPIQPLLDDPDVTEVMVNGPDRVYIERGGRVEPVTGCTFRDADHLLHHCQTVLAPLGRRLDTRNCLEDGRLPDGSRVNAVCDVALGGPFLTVRKFPERRWTLPALVTEGACTPQIATLLAWLVRNRCNILVAGGTGSGKTSLLNALSGCIPHHERTVTIEDSAELRLSTAGHVLGLEARPAAANGAGAVTIRDLVRNALRMRPDRIIVGEVRDGAALDMLQAANTGHEGSMTTVHANGPDEACNDRLPVMVAQGGSDLPQASIAYLVSAALDIVVYTRRYEDGTRRVDSVSEVLDADTIHGTTRVEVVPLIRWEQSGITPDGGLAGCYHEVGHISAALLDKRRLRHAPPLTMADVAAFTATEEQPC